MQVAIIGAGWAGLAAAVQTTREGHVATVFEASRALGGRARALNATLPDGTPVTLDNGQHILIGAYSETLGLMQQVGVDPARALLRLPLTLRFPDGSGLACPRWPSPLDALAGIVAARGWGWRDKGSLLRASVQWQRARFECAASTTVAGLCQAIRPRVMQELIAPLCVSALNTPADRASGQVFLRVLRDSLFGVQGGSHLLLPRVDLSTLFPAAAAAWISRRGGTLRLGQRVDDLRPLQASGALASPGPAWQVNGQAFDAVVLAVSASESARALLQSAQYAPENIAPRLRHWSGLAQALQFEGITTVYAWAPQARLPHPMLALRSTADAPAQFVFDRGQLGGPPGLLAFVVSASQGGREALQTQVLAQARAMLGLTLQPVQTVVEKRATFACTPGLQRPPARVAPGLVACGDYLEGPYPATLEGAVRSGLAAVALIQKR